MTQPEADQPDVVINEDEAAAIVDTNVLAPSGAEEPSMELGQIESVAVLNYDPGSGPTNVVHGHRIVSDFHLPPDQPKTVPLVEHGVQIGQVTNLRNVGSTVLGDLEFGPLRRLVPLTISAQVGLRLRPVEFETKPWQDEAKPAPVFHATRASSHPFPSNRRYKWDPAEKLPDAAKTKAKMEIDPVIKEAYRAFRLTAINMMAAVLQPLLEEIGKLPPEQIATIEQVAREIAKRQFDLVDDSVKRQPLAAMAQCHTRMHMKEKLDAALRKLGVIRAASQDDPNRWSATDLATDLSDLLLE